MAHRSGGGHHSGGFHSSSSHHHSSSYHSSGSHNSVPMPRYGRRPFPHSRRYVYYHRGLRQPCFYYYSGEEALRQKPPTRAGLIVKCVLSSVFVFTFLLISLSVGIAIFTGGSGLPVQSTCIIDDRVGVIEDQSQVLQAMEAFRDASKVVPYVEIITEDELGYYPLDDYALNEYNKLFNDERHWLFVYSIDGSNTSIITGRWSWEGIIGDDTDFTIGNSGERYCTDRMQYRLTEPGVQTFDEALTNAFYDMADYTSKPYVQRNAGVLIAYVVLMIFLPILILPLLILSSIKNYRLRVAMSQSIPVADAAEEMLCPVCSGKYYAGTLTACPYCGAAIVIPNEPESKSAFTDTFNA